MSDLPLILMAARQHPDDSLRKSLSKAVDEHIEESDPHYSATEIVELLATVSGTPIEPFELAKQDLSLAVALARLAFSARYERTRFRIVSRETLGTAGGAVLTDNLRHFYIERYARGRWTTTPSQFWFVAPAAMPTAPKTQASTPEALEARCTVSDRGVEITLEADWPPGSSHDASIAPALNRNSHFLPGNKSLRSAGLSVSASSGRVSIRTGGPEAVFRLSALMQQRAIMVIDAGDEAAGLGRIFIGLVPLDRDDLRLRSLLTLDRSPATAWAGIDIGRPLPLSLSERLQIAEWYGPHDRWINDEFIEAVFT